MIDFLFSLEGLTSLMAFAGAGWGLIQKFKASQALKAKIQTEVTAEEQRQELLKQIDENRTIFENELGEMVEKMDTANTVARDELAILRGQLAKLMDMVISGEDLSVSTIDDDVVVTGSAGDVRVKERTLNKVVEVTSHVKYKRGLGGGLKRVAL